MADNTTETSNTNTILLVILIIAVVAFGMYFLLGRGLYQPAETNRDGIDVKVDLTNPGNSSSSGGSGAPGPSY